jgi:hypothetical protein
VLYGRRRCGKSRLLTETLPTGASVLFVADEREAALQRASLASEMGRLLPGFDKVTYPDWEALLERWWSSAPAGSVLALDEFQALAISSPELPSLLQRFLDQRHEAGLHLVLSGSSQRLMMGLLLDRTAPLFGRASELMRISALQAGWVLDGLSLKDPVEAVESYATWGGVPRYWELAREHSSRAEALQDLVLDPLGVLYREPDTLLLDDTRDPAQAASILHLVGAGCHRMSEIAGRLGKPSSSLARPLQRLLELELLRRDRPFGASAKDSKKSLYRIADPFLAYWFTHVAPNRSRLEAGLVAKVARDIAVVEGQHIGRIWEDLARASVPHLPLHGLEWNPAASWWGADTFGRPLEVDVVAESTDGGALLAGSVKWEGRTDLKRVIGELRDRAERLPFREGRPVHLAVWTKTPAGRVVGDVKILGAHETLTALRL